MKAFVQSALALAPASVLAVGLMAAAPATAQVVGMGVNGQPVCNPVIGWGNTPAVTGNGVAAVHSGSYACPPAAAAPAPTARAVQPEYLVFFDWDKSNITPAADRVLSDVVAALGTNSRTAMISVVGHTDTSGAPQYNQRLSERRAAAIRQALVAKGVPAANITTAGRGETQLLVQTGPNVREPSNRRGQIIPRVGTGPTS